MVDIILTAPYSEMSERARKLQKKFKLNVSIIESALDEAVELVRTKLTESPDAILISRGATADLLERVFPKSHLLRMDPTEFDLIHAFDRAKQTKKKIGYVGRTQEENHFRIKDLSRMLNIKINFYWYKDSSEFLKQMNKAINEGVEVIIGGGMRGELMCLDKGIEHISLISGDTTMYQVFSRAADIIQTEKKAKEQSTLIRTIVDLLDEGLIAVNSAKEITIMNRKAINLLSVRLEEVQNRKIKDLNPSNKLVQLIEDKDTQTDKIVNLNNTTLMVNKTTYEVKNDRGFLFRVQDVTHIQESEKKIRRQLYKKGLVAKYTFEDIIYKSKTMDRVIIKAKRFSRVDGNVLILGESGTGKELLAQSIHNDHPTRYNSPFVAINCAAITDTLLESELFGYEKGTFTGASKEGKAGLFELSHGGTIFLDEIDKMSFSLQAKLLRVLQEREVRRIGGDRNIPIDVRVIAASNRDLKQMVEKGLFRVDLYYRLESLILRLPALRERKADFKCLSSHMLRKISSIYNKQVSELSELALLKMEKFNWPGNLRQLENILERSIVMSDNSQEIEMYLLEAIDEEKDLTIFSDNPANIKNENDKLIVPIGTLEDIQKSVIEQMINKNINKSELADKLGISRTTLWKLLKKGGIS